MSSRGDSPKDFAGQDPASVALRAQTGSIHDRYLAAVGNFEREQLAQFLPKRRALIGFCRMRQEERRLIDDDEIVGLVDDFEAQRPIVRRTLSDVFVVAHPSDSDLRRAWRCHRLPLSFPGATAACGDRARGSCGLCWRRDYFRNGVGQVHADRKPGRAILASAAIHLSLSAAGLVRIVFRSEAVPGLG